jgi:hypothetical protein
LLEHSFTLLVYAAGIRTSRKYSWTDCGLVEHAPDDNKLEAAHAIGRDFSRVAQKPTLMVIDDIYSSELLASASSIKRFNVQSYDLCSSM